jgi:hypothetical protein
MKKRSSYYGNVLQRDKPLLGDEDTFWTTPGGVNRFEEKPIRTDDNYLYTDINADRFNAPRVDSQQEHGQPRGMDNDISPINDLDSGISADDAGLFYDPVLVKTFGNDEDIISDVVKRKMNNR